MKCCQRFFGRSFSFRHFYSDGHHVVNIELCCWEALYSALYRSGGMRYANECCYCDEMFCDSVSDSWLRGRGRDGARMRNSEPGDREQRQLQSIREKKECELRSNLWTFWVDHSKCQHLWCLCMMPVVLWPWPPVLWWQCGLSHLVVTNKSNKNPQLIRSDSVQNSFSLLWPIVLGLIYSNVTDWACGNWLKKVRELFQKLFAVNWRWYP